MMNAMALCLVLTSLLTAGFFTPTPETQNPQEENVIVKEGHRVVVVEFERDDNKHTKVLISPPDPEKITADEPPSETKDEEEPTHDDQHGFRPRELVCDAYGKCLHKLSSALEKTEEAVSEKAHVATEKAHEVEEETKKGVTEKVKKVVDTVGQTAHQVFDKMHDSKQSFKDAKDEKAGEIKKEAEKFEEEVEEKIEDAKQVPKRAEKELSEILHRGRDVWVDAFRYAFSPERLAALGGVLHMMGFSAAFGMCVWVTFASSSVLMGALPRNQFAVVQSRIYPVYFNAMAYSVGMAMLGHLMGRGAKGGVGLFQGLNLMASLAMILVNLIYLEPRATKVMFERMKKEKEEGKGKEGHITEASGSAAEVAGRGGFSTAEVGGRLEKQKEEEIAAAAKAKSEMVRLSEKLQKLNSYSSFLNVSTLMALTWHLVHLGQRVHLATRV